MQTVTNDDFHVAWSNAYWDARDDGMTLSESVEHADDVTEFLLDRLEEG